MAEPVELLINGERFEGFEGGSVTQALDAALVATTFTLEYSPRVAPELERVRIEAGDEVTLRVGDENLVRGYVVDDFLAYDARSSTFQVSGASRLIDAVECSAIHRARRFRDQALFELAEALLEDYPISIVDVAGDAAAEPIARFALQEGESIVEALTRAARLRGVLLQDVAGDLVITRTGSETTRTVISRARNVLTGSRRRSWRERFSEYHFRGQTRTSDDVNGLDAAQIGQVIEDLEVTRVRRLAVTAHGDRRGDMGRRAILERNVRAGRSEQLSYELAGWMTEEGRLWRPNTRVRVVDDWLEVEAELLVGRVTHAFQARPGRYRTSLELVRPETFAEVDFPRRGRGQRWA